MYIVKGELVQLNGIVNSTMVGWGRVGRYVILFTDRVAMSSGVINNGLSVNFMPFL